MIAGLHAGDAESDLAHDACAFMSEDRRKESLRIGARERKGVGVTDAGRLDFHKHLAGFRAIDLDRLDGEGFSGFPGDGGAGLHRLAPGGSAIV